MRTLILSCNTGEGHNSCARAIQRVYEAHGLPCDRIDALHFVSDPFSRMVSHGHSTMYNHSPRLFDRGYGFFERHPLLGRSSGAIFASGSRPLAGYIARGNYDVVICTHPFAATMLRYAHTDVKSAFVATDYTCSPTVKECGADFCFIPAEDLRADFLCDSLSDDHIVTSGIPIDSGFFSTPRQPQARSHLVMMGGSMGCGPMENILDILSREDSFDISVVCGKNTVLYRRLTDSFPQSHIRILGYVRDMPTLLRSADLYLTKPGGLSTTEAAVSSVPMVFIDAVGGCEEYNLRYFCERGGALAGWEAADTAALCLSLMKNTALRAEMSEALRVLSIPNGAEIIFQTMTGQNI
ncbi:MAG: hypothetical protein E7442_04360 [Ruminococcaceae bacterium]|nr:hypothetical protein [Oscillospiraceae bacterium]